VEAVKTLWWLSFADPALPEGRQFLGACMVDVDDTDLDEPLMVRAVRAAHRLGCNPGGHVQGHPIPPDIALRVPSQWRARLLTRPECTALDLAMRKTVS
jgi:hypothetical protein